MNPLSTMPMHLRPKPRAFRRRSPPRAYRWAPLLLLFLSLGIAVVALVQAHQAVRSHRATADGLIADYASFATWMYRQNGENLLDNAFHAALGRVHRYGGHAAGERVPTDEPPTAADLLAEALHPRTAECSPHYGAPYYFRVALDSLDAPVQFAGGEPGTPVGTWLADTLRTHAAAAYQASWPYAMVSGRVGGRAVHLAYSVVQAPGGMRYAYGFEFDPARFRPLFQKVMDEKPLLPPELADGRGNGELLLLRVSVPDAGVLYASSGEVGGWEPESREEFAERFGGLTTWAVVRPEVAESLIIGGLPRSRLPLLAGLLLLAAGLAVVAVWQLRREGELARLRSDFVSSVSHELRTPLAQVRLFLETMRLGRYSTEQQRDWLLDNMDRETTRLTGLVDNVLHFSRAERGAPGGEMEQVELPAYLEQVVGSFAPLAASRRVRFETRFEPGLVGRVDPESFRQVILNLLDNAAKYGPRGQTVRVSAAAAEGRVRIAVEDEGPGVEPAEREQIWEPFRRGRRAVGSVAVGSGIGLSVVREIVHRHGGRAWVENATGGGARFVVEVAGWREARVAPERIAAPAADLREAV